MNEQNLKAGDQVICSLHPEKGEGRLTLYSPSLGQAMVVWGAFNNMHDPDRFVEVCKLDEVKKAD